MNGGLNIEGKHAKHLFTGTSCSSFSSAETIRKIFQLQLMKMIYGDRWNGNTF